MATTKVSELTELTSPDGAEQLLVNDGGTSKRLLVSNLPVGSLGANSVDSDQYVDGSIDTAHIGDDQVTYAKIQNVSATDRILGRDSSGAGVVEEITPANLRTMINVADGSNAYVHPNHSGEVTSTADGATVIADNIVDEANLKVSNSPTNGQFLSAQSGNTGGLTWADVDALPSQTGNSGEFLTTNGTAASWAEIATGNTTTSPMWEMAHTVSTNYTMTTNYNGVSVAPVTINSGVSVTVPTGSTWTIV